LTKNFLDLKFILSKGTTTEADETTMGETTVTTASSTTATTTTTTTIDPTTDQTGNLISLLIAYRLSYIWCRYKM
jgi:hypothetical protein